MVRARMKSPHLTTSPHLPKSAVGTGRVPTSPPSPPPIEGGSGGGAGKLLILADGVRRFSPHCYSSMRLRPGPPLPLSGRQVEKGYALQSDPSWRSARARAGGGTPTPRGRGSKEGLERGPHWLDV